MARTVASLVNPARGDAPRQAQAYAGKFATSPVAVTDDVYVTLNDFDDGAQRFGPVTWEPRLGSNAGGLLMVLPSRGDPCAVVLDDDDQEWVVAWRPA